MTGEEKRRILKEQYKKDLQKRKEFLEGAKRLRHTKKLNDAVTDLTSSLTNDDSDEWIEKLNQESALTEAKMEMHLDEQSSVTAELEKLAKEAEAERFSAEQLILDMKREMGLLPQEDKSAKKTEAKDESTSKSESSDKKKAKDDSKNDGPPKKRLGDF